MTLIITAIRPEGVFQSADCRVTTKDERVLDDARPKHLSIKPAPVPGGPRVLLGFTGLAEMPDGTPMVRWMRETIRGESRFVMPLLEFLRDRPNRDVGRSRLRLVPLLLAGGIVQADGRRFYVQIANVDRDWKPLGDFRLVVIEVSDRAFSVAGSGMPHVSQSDRRLLWQQLHLRPAKWENHLGLLAAINRRAACADPDGGVSPWCEAHFASVAGESVTGRRFRERGEPAGPLLPQMVLDGVDVVEMFQYMHASGLETSRLMTRDAGR